MDRVKKLVAFLNKYFTEGDAGEWMEGRVQTFNTPCRADDYQETIYNEDGIVVNFCGGYGYIDVLGLSDTEFKTLMDTCEVCYQ